MAGKVGFLFNPRALWIGLHYSPFNKRLCVNVLPCLTFYFVAAGGNLPCVDGDRALQPEKASPPAAECAFCGGNCTPEELDIPCHIRAFPVPDDYIGMWNGCDGGEGEPLDRP